MKKILILLVFLLHPILSFGQELDSNLSEIIRAEVVGVISEEQRVIPGTGAISSIQYLKAEVLEGSKKGQIIEIENDLFDLNVGDRFFFSYISTPNGTELYSIRDIDRQNPILFIVALFVLVVVLFSGLQGVRSILSLIASFVVIIYVLLPLVIKGYNPVWTSIFIGALILFFAIYFTHGFNKHSSVAFGGTVIAVLFTGFLANFAISFTKLTGFFSDEAVFLNFNTGGTLDFQGLLLGAIIIGVLGVLDDIAVTQVSVVGELKSANSNLSKKDLYLKAIKVGKDHTSSLVNTLVLAYTSVSLPLLLLISQSDTSILKIINSEVFSTEIVRTIVGSIGLILTVPITTFLAVMFIKPNEISMHQGHHH